ncbi:MAG: hypothetical protein ABIB46_04465 [bacterium]
MKFYFILFFLFFFVSNSTANFYPIISDQEDLQNALFNNEISQETYQKLFYFLINKIDINSDDIWNLINIPDVFIQDIEKIYEYRLKNRNFTKKEEIKNIPDFKIEVYQRIDAFINVFPIISNAFKTNIKVEYEKDFFKNIALFKGKTYILFDKHLKAFFSILNEKEKIRYFQIKDVSYIKKITLGQTYVSFGENLVFGSQIDGLYNKLNFGFFSPSFIYSQDELKVLNLNFEFKKNNFGFTYLDSKNSFQIGGFYNKFWFGDSLFFSEFAGTKKQNISFIIGLDIDREKFHLLHFYRNYKNFVNPFSNAFTSDDNQNEEGIYIDLIYYFNSKITLNTSFNCWQHFSKFISHELKSSFLTKITPKIAFEIKTKLKNVKEIQTNIFYGNLIYTPFSNLKIIGSLKKELAEKLFTLKTNYKIKNWEIKLFTQNKQDEKFRWGELKEKYYIEIIFNFSNYSLGGYFNQTFYNKRSSCENVKIWIEYNW